MPLAWGGQEPAITSVADKLLVAPLQRCAQIVEESGTCRSIPLRLVGIKTDHITARLASWPPVADHHFLDLECGFRAACPLNDQRHHRLVVGQHNLAHFAVAALAGTKDIFLATRLQFGDRLRTDHPAVSNQAHPSNAKALAQARDK